ncbi:spore germination protein KA [Paenibacillus rhizosphaerae]|uniref:Spore germination protein KA n=1 Tax=Paenibacillus rhizosphaerae TaxID=297318 RepID=A0A839TPN4_9BACL|nr:spore germination protein [Paenibacillus rhizosphaerae]MBB3128463.1 spore germination protein KA [Paenibacillus rhizosphaerae]
MDLVDRYILKPLQQQPDFKIHRFHVDSDIQVTCSYLDTLVDKEQIQQFILIPLLEIRIHEGGETEEKRLSWIRDRLSGVSYSVELNPEKWASLITEGKCVLLIQNDNQGYAFDVSKFQHRSITEPKSEKTVRGPAEAFTEDVMTNVALIRSRIKSPQLVFESYDIGQTTRTKVLMAYIKGKASEERIQAYRDRLNNIHTDAIFESANIEEWIEHKEITPFPRVLNSERPDVVSSHLTEGRIVILTDGTPHGLIVPVTFFQFFISAEDYYQRAIYSTFLRWLRFLAFLLSIYTPCIYIALINYRQELIPTTLLFSLAAQREGVPFPAFVEAFMMLIMFEILREAGIRMPTAIGQAISIVGAVVLGQAAVEAGLVSASMVIIVGVTAITNFISPSFSFGMAQRILQFVFMILAISLALFGILCGTLLLVVHLSSLKTTGEPYLSPVAPLQTGRFRDTLVRVPWYKMKKSGR